MGEKRVWLAKLMNSIKMVTFCKSRNCPSSQDLLAFQYGNVSRRDREKIDAHLSNCEFCFSELEFYAHYPQSEEPVAKVEIPLPLFELAKALLSDKNQDFLILNKLLGETESVKI